MVYAEMLAERIKKHGAHVWLLNTGWTGGPYGVGNRFKLSYTRTFVTRILDGSLAKVPFETHPIFGLQMPTAVEGVPSDVLNPRNTWVGGPGADKAAYDAKATELAKKFRENESKFKMTAEVIAAGPRV